MECFMLVCQQSEPLCLLHRGYSFCKGVFMKPYISIDEQISLLESRNVLINNYHFAYRVLEYENYYCAVNGYKAPFIASTNPDCYKEGTLFNEIVALYTFDRRLREILFPDLLRIEHVIKSYIINVFSANHGNNHTSYLRPESFNCSSPTNLSRVNEMIFDLMKMINKRKFNHEAIAHYVNKYGFVPLWVLSKVMTFGKINSFYANYISLTDIAKYKNPNFPADVVKNWMRIRNTIEFLGLWEQFNNPDFKLVEFDQFKADSGSNAFVLPPQQWIKKTNAIGIQSKSGRYGGTYAHPDIAFEFASWISP